MPPSRRTLPRACLLALPVSLVFSLAQTVRAADGTWNVDAGGDWSLSDTSPWSGGVVAAGADFTASFTSVITSDSTVSLTDSLTIGNLVFTGNGDNLWTLNGSALTLSSTSGTSTITTTGGAATISAVLDGSNGMTKAGGSTLILTGTHTYTGTTTVSAGSLQLLNGASVAGDIVLGITGERLVIDGGAPNTITGVISGSGAIRKNNSAGVLMLTAENTFTGGVTVQDGTLLLSTATNGGVGTGAVKVGYRATIRSSDNDSRTISKINLNNAGGGLTFGDAQGGTTYTGDITFTDTSTGNALNGNTKLTVTNSTTVTINKQFTGGRINKWGTGTLILNGNSTYSGATTANEGLLVVNGAMNNSAFTVSSGARLGGIGSSGALTFAAGAGLVHEVATAGQTDHFTAASFASDAIGGFTIYLTGDAEGFDAQQNYSWTVLTTTDTSAGSVSLASITLDTSGFGQAFGGTFGLGQDESSIYVTYSAVPEPATYALLAGASLLGLAVCRRRRVRG